MKTLALFIATLLMSTSVLSAGLSKQDCGCKNCKCTEENHCGCFSKEGCKCSSGETPNEKECPVTSAANK